MLQARNIPYKHIVHANSVPIVQKQIKRYNAEKSVNCSLCHQRIAQHSIVFYDDLPYVIEHLLLGESQNAITEAIWQKVVQEQRKGVYAVKATLFVCTPCVVDQLYQESRQRDAARSYLDAVQISDEVSLIIGRFPEKPYHPALFYTICPSIKEFVAEFREHSLKSKSRPARYGRSCQVERQT